MSKNRTELISAVNTQIVPTVTTAIHRDLLNNELIDSMVTRKDVIATEVVSGGVVTIDYSNKDLATITAPDNVTVLFSNIENGEVKYLKITKEAGKTIAFAGATDTSVRKTYINKGVTLVVYSVTNKDNVIYVNSINIDNNIDTLFLFAVNELITPTLLNGWTAAAASVQSIVYFKNQFGDLRIYGTAISENATAATIFTLPETGGFRPLKTNIVAASDVSITPIATVCLVTADGNVSIDASVFTDGYTFDVTIPRELLA